MGWFSKRKPADADDEPLDVPPGTAVDPALFPEDEFPVACLGCGYALRGLPDGRCPECGRRFERGILLVESYYLDSRRRRRTMVVGEFIASTGIGVLGTSLLLICYLVIPEFRKWPPDFSRLPQVLWRSFFVDLPLIPFGLILLALGLVLPTITRSGIDRSKREAIKAALRKQTIETAATKPAVEAAGNAE